MLLSLANYLNLTNLCFMRKLWWERFFKNIILEHFDLKFKGQEKDGKDFTQLMVEDIKNSLYDQKFIEVFGKECKYKTNLNGK